MVGGGTHRSSPSMHERGWIKNFYSSRCSQDHKGNLGIVNEGNDLTAKGFDNNFRAI